MSELETRPVWIVWQNTDLTEGRGHQVPIAVCAARSTARRMSKKMGVQGSDADVSSFEAVLHKNIWCAPVQVIPPSKEDLAKEKSMAELQAVVDRAKALGLSKEDLQIIARGEP